MEPVPVTATMTVHLPARPGGKPRDTVADLAMCDEAIKAFTVAKIAILAAQASIDSVAAVDATPVPAPVPGAGDDSISGDVRAARRDTWVKDAPADDAVAAFLPGAAPKVPDTWVHLTWLSCGCTFPGPLTWPAGRTARCAEHGEVATVDAPQCPAGLLRESEDWADACKRDSGHEPPHRSEHNGDWTDDHPRHLPDISAHHFGEPGEAAAIPEESIATGRPVIVTGDEVQCGLREWGDTELCTRPAGHEPVPSCKGKPRPFAWLRAGSPDLGDVMLEAAGLDREMREPSPDDDDGAARLAAGELAADEIATARDRSAS